MRCVKAQLYQTDHDAATEVTMGETKTFTEQGGVIDVGDRTPTIKAVEPPTMTPGVKHYKGNIAIGLLPAKTKRATKPNSTLSDFEPVRQIHNENNTAYNQRKSPIDPSTSPSQY